MQSYRTLYEIAVMILAETDRDTVLRLAADQLIEITGAKRCFIALLSQDNQLEFEVSRNLAKEDILKPEFEVSMGIVHATMEKQATQIIGDALAESQLVSNASVQRLRLLSVICTPIFSDGKPIGTLYADNNDGRNLFNEHTAALLEALADLIPRALSTASTIGELRTSQARLEEELRGKFEFSEIVGSGQKMVSLLNMVADVADTEATILIQGENGTGKELIARAIHFNSRRKNAPFVAVNCAALPADLIESEIFGHVRGAFTGAVKDNPGKFRLAHGGTIFLDEIAEMDLAVQAKLLRVLQEKHVWPVGGTAAAEADVRVIVASNKRLDEQVASAQFREDLYYRLNVIELQIPPLRERIDDIPLLVEHFINKYAVKQTAIQVDRNAQHALSNYTYPGNIRQLENIIHRACILSKGETISLEHLPSEVIGNEESHDGHAGGSLSFSERKRQAIDKFERVELERLLVESKGKVRAGARLAGMDVKNFAEKLKRHGISAQNYK